MESSVASENQANNKGGKKLFLLVTCSLFLLYWMGDAFLTSFYAHFFVENGMSASQQSILLGIVPFALFLGCLVLSPLARDSRGALRMFRICALIEAGLGIGFAFCHSFWALLPMTFLIGFFNGAPFAFIEGYVAPRAKALGISYSAVRVFGTIGYVVSLVIGYFLLAKMPIRDCYFIGSGLYLGGLAVSFALSSKKAVYPETKKTKKPINFKAFFSKTLVIFLISQLFLYGAFNAMTYILPVRLKDLGLSDADYSLIRGIGMAAELVTMLVIPLFAKRIRLHKTPILIASFACLLACSTGIYISGTYALGYSALVLGGIGKAFLFAYQALFFQDIVGEERLPEALTFNMAFTNLASALLNLLSSTIYTSWGFPALFGIITGLEAVGVLLVIATRPSEAPVSEE